MAGAYCSTHGIEDPPKGGPFCYYPPASAPNPEWIWLPSVAQRIGAPTPEDVTRMEMMQAGLPPDGLRSLTVKKIGAFVQMSDEMLKPPPKPSWRSRVRWRVRCWWWDLRDRIGFAIAHSSGGWRDEED